MITEFRGQNYFLSNFFAAPITYLGLTYQNNEAAFQAMKCIDVKDREKFTKLNPSEAKKLGRRVNLRRDWEEVKTDIMYDICKAKFDQNPALKVKLLNTGTQELIEGNTWGDRIWGCVNGVGQNKLGKILMKIRDEYKTSAN